ncbi:MAG: alpha/beta hydrolase [Candidatus Eisenbacteria bacterium]|nr:alpha/beta hydrolase [Candidatus Eisenbacteria bacterium]
MLRVRTIGAAVLVVLFLLAAGYAWLVRMADRSFERAIERARAIEVEAIEIGEARDGIAEVRITGAGGERAIGLRREISPEDHLRLRVLLIGGIGTGENAARLVVPFPGAEIYSFEYPLAARLPRGDALSKAASIPSLIKGTAESLVSFGLAKRAIFSRGDGASNVLIGVSLGVPFAAALASIGEKPDAVALLYGGGDIGPIIARALPSGPFTLRALAGRTLGRLLARLDPARTAGGIAPAPLLLVSAEDDPRIPAASVRALHDAARDPKTVVLLGGGHVLPEKEALLEELVREVVAWLRELQLLQDVGEAAPPAEG